MSDRTQSQLAAFQRMRPLDDPVLEGVKRHLAISDRIGFEPMSWQRFANIAFQCKRRMAMTLTRYDHYHYQQKSNPQGDFLTLVVNDGKNGANECPARIALRDFDTALRSLFQRIRKWRSVDVAHCDYIDHYAKADLMGECACMSATKRQVVETLLGAIAAEHDDDQSIVDIHRFACGPVPNRQQMQESLAAFLPRAAPNLRSLTVVLSYSSSTEELPLPVLIEAMAACQQLRHLAVGTAATPDHFPPAFQPMLLGLPRLDCLQLGGWNQEEEKEDDKEEESKEGEEAEEGGDEESEEEEEEEEYGEEEGAEQQEEAEEFSTAEEGRHRLGIDERWLPVVAQPAFEPLLKKMQCLGLKLNCEDFALVALIFRALRRPARVFIDLGDPWRLWPAVWHDLLPLVHATGASVQLQCPSYDHDKHQRLTGAGFAGALARLPANVQAALLPMPLALGYHYYRLPLIFRFKNAGGDLFLMD